MKYLHLDSLKYFFGVCGCTPGLHRFCTCFAQVQIRLTGANVLHLCKTHIYWCRLRFIDDIFMIWQHGRDELDKFIVYLNQVLEKIKFITEVSTHSVKFLDTTIKIDTDNTLYTTLYEKPTDTHLYLHYQSAHHGPCHTKGPYGQFLRIRRICSKNDDFINNGIKMIERYLKRGYLFQQLKKHMLRACKFTQDELLDVKTKEPTKVPVMTTMFNPTNPDIKKFIYGNWNIIENSIDCAQTFPEKPIFGFKRLPNLRDILTKASISYPPAENETK